MANINNGKTFKESELRFYGFINDYSELSKYSFSDIEQWGIKIKDPNLVNNDYAHRTRLEIVNNKKIYTTCIKTGDISNERICTPDEFEILKKIFKEGMVKRRYRIPVENSHLTWELDLFYTRDNKSFFKWCMLELELNGYNGEVPAYPSMFIYKYKNGDGDIVADLYEKCFITKK